MAVTINGSGQVFTKVVQTVKTDVFAASGNIKTWADITGMSVTITPSSTANRILILVQMTGSGQGGVVAASFRLVRGSTPIYFGDASGTRAQGFSQTGTNEGAFIGQQIAMYIDSPATTSPVTYKIQSWNENGNTFYVNRTSRDNDNNDTRQASSITAIEISG